MPTYEYYCSANDETVEVLHPMRRTIATWGELCDCAEIEVGDTSSDACVERKLSAVSILPKKGETHHHGDTGTHGFGRGCCGGGGGGGGGCGCGGH